jgi:predicted SAM-dependent methyltransferase
MDTDLKNVYFPAMIKEVIAARAQCLARAKFDEGCLRFEICGGITPYSPKFNNVDIAPESQPDFLMDITQGICLPDCSIDEIVTIATLEHLTFLEFMFVFSEMERVLKVGGKISISTPDIEKIAHYMIANGFRNHFDKINQNIFGLQRDRFDVHKLALSAGYFSALLTEMGFSKITLEDENFSIRHDLELSCRVSAYKTSIRKTNDWLSKYRKTDEVLALAPIDRIRFSQTVKEFDLYLPENFQLAALDVEASMMGEVFSRQELLPGRTTVRLPQDTGLEYLDVDLVFSQSIVPENLGINEDTRELSSFLLWPKPDVTS